MSAHVWVEVGSRIIAGHNEYETITLTQHVCDNCGADTETPPGFVPRTGFCVPPDETTAPALLKVLRELYEDGAMESVYNLDPDPKIHAPLEDAMRAWAAAGYPGG